MRSCRWKAAPHRARPSRTARNRLPIEVPSRCVMNEELRDLIYDWNIAGEQPPRAGGKKIEFDDETLRDGLQSPSVTDPSLDEKVRALHYMNDIGVDSADIGLPGAGPHVQRSVE